MCYCWWKSLPLDILFLFFEIQHNPAEDEDEILTPHVVMYNWTGFASSSRDKST